MRNTPTWERERGVHTSHWCWYRWCTQSHLSKGFGKWRSWFSSRAIPGSWIGIGTWQRAPGLLISPPARVAIHQWTWKSKWSSNLPIAPSGPLCCCLGSTRLSTSKRGGGNEGDRGVRYLPTAADCWLYSQGEHWRDVSVFPFTLQTHRMNWPCKSVPGTPVWWHQIHFTQYLSIPALLPKTWKFWFPQKPYRKPEFC